MNRVIRPLKLFGAKFTSKKGELPVYINGSKILKPIKFKENLGSAQCKSVGAISIIKNFG